MPPDAATNASRVVQASISMAPNELALASSSKRRSWRCTAAAISGKGLSMPAPVLPQCTSATWVMLVSIKAAIASGNCSGLLPQAIHFAQICQYFQNALAIRAVIGRDACAVFRHESARSVTSTENVPSLAVARTRGFVLHGQFRAAFGRLRPSCC